MAVATSGQPHIGAAAAGVPTVANAFARDWAPPGPPPGGDAGKGSRDLAGRTPGPCLGRRRRRRPRTDGARGRARRSGLDPCRGSTRVGDPRSGHRRRAGHHCRAYPTNPAAEVEYLLGDCGASVHLAEDQEQADKVMGRSTAPCPGPAHDHPRRAAGMPGLERSTGYVLGRLPGARPSPPGRRTRTASTSGWRRRRRRT